MNMRKYKYKKAKRRLQHTQQRPEFVDNYNNPYKNMILNKPLRRSMEYARS